VKSSGIKGFNINSVVATANIVVDFAAIINCILDYMVMVVGIGFKAGNIAITPTTFLDYY